MLGALSSINPASLSCVLSVHSCHWIPGPSLLPTPPPLHDDLLWQHSHHLGGVHTQLPLHPNVFLIIQFVFPGQLLHLWCSWCFLTLLGPRSPFCSLVVGPKCSFLSPLAVLIVFSWHSWRTIATWPMATHCTTPPSWPRNCESRQCTVPFRERKLTSLKCLLCPSVSTTRKSTTSFVMCLWSCSWAGLPWTCVHQAVFYVVGFLGLTCPLPAYLCLLHIHHPCHPVHRLCWGPPLGLLHLLLLPTVVLLQYGCCSLVYCCPQTDTSGNKDCQIALVYTFVTFVSPLLNPLICATRMLKVLWGMTSSIKQPLTPV